MTPNDLDVLIHYHVSAVNHPRLEAPAVKESIDRYVTDGILTPIHDRYVLTEKGHKFLVMILSTPYPALLWVDPRGESNRTIGLFVEQG